MIAPEKGRLLFLFIWYEATGARMKALSTLHVCVVAEKKVTFSSAAPRFCGRGEVIFATILRKQFPSNREGGAGPRRQATNGGPHLWHRSDGKLEVTARAQSVGDEEKKKEWVEKRGFDKRGKQEGCNTRTSQEVTHPSTTLAQARVTAEF